MKDDIFTINVLINGFKFPLKIARGDEELYRRAERMVTKWIEKFQRQYRQRPNEEILSLVAFQMATIVMKQELTTDTTPLVEKIRELEEELEDLLKKE
ncbi:MAG TPA: cell division protein ZapA [Paludibacter sp.]|nr:cell division protein ZapA [Paludibacter sp.]